MRRHPREVLEIETAAAPADDEIQVLLRDVLSDLDEAMERLVQGVARQRVLRERPERLVVAFFGRTMAGKSTLVETLSGGTGEAIGVGGQRTTRETRYCDWGDVALLDTPGIGAFRGEKVQKGVLAIVAPHDRGVRLRLQARTGSRAHESWQHRRRRPLPNSSAMTLTAI